jgi:hypothetical protein
VQRDQQRRVPVVTRAVLFALACGVALGVVVGRRLPRDAPSPTASAASTPVLPAPSACGAERMQLTSVRAQLAVCNARLAQAISLDAGPASTPTAPTADGEPAAPASPVRASLPPMFPDLPTDGGYPAPPLREYVIVRHRDGTVWSHPPKDWSTNRDDGTVLARSYPGRWGYFAPDAGPDDPPIALHDLAGPDGCIMVAGTQGRTCFHRQGDADAGAP